MKKFVSLLGTLTMKWNKETDSKKEDEDATDNTEIDENNVGHLIKLYFLSHV